MSDIRYKTLLGKFLVGDSIEILAGQTGRKLANKVQLILTSPPFPLNNKKRYGNKQGPEYREWFTHLAEIFAPLLTETELPLTTGIKTGDTGYHRAVVVGTLRITYCV